VTQVAVAAHGTGRSDSRAIFGTVIAESNLVVSWRARPRGFAALMGLYESNYLRLAALAGNLAALAASHISEVADDCTLVLNVLGRSRYTSELQLAYLMPARGAAAVIERVPDLRLRVYHDARVLEACPAEGSSADRELDRRWARNMMVNKWLEYCAERGHSFVRGGIDPHSA
jgi:uncharacterized protein YqiB (DUF1249 family)